jgi:phospholipase D1/2
VRFLPVAPFAVINLAFGAIGVRHRDYIISTALASIPGVLGVALIGDRLSEVFTSPTPQSVAILVAVVATVAGAAALLQRLLKRTWSR